MMKNKSFYLFLVLTAFTACSRKDDSHLFSESADERLNKALTVYQNQLTSAANGWKAVIYPAGGRAFSFYFKFNDSNRVKMVSDFDSLSAVTLKESSYRLKTLQQPSIIFDTYSYLHVLADPAGTVNGGSNGSGLLSDFEFYFDSSSPDTINLVGRMNGSKAMLVKATADEARVFTTGLFNINQFRGNYGRILEYFKRLTIGGQTYEVNIDVNTRNIIFNWLDASGVLQSFTTKFYFTTNGIGLVNPFSAGVIIIKELSNVNWLSVTNNLEVTIGTVKGSIAGAIAPLKLDVNAAQKWYNQMALNFNGCWVSDNAFHVNGVDDYCNFKSVPAYQTLWYAGPAVFGGTSEGLIVFTGALSSPYCLSKTPFAVNAGIARFTLLTSVGTFTGTTQKAISMTMARNIMYNGEAVNNFQDWYLIPTTADGLHYDMVRTSDARAWISWRPR